MNNAPARNVGAASRTVPTAKAAPERYVPNTVLAPLYPGGPTLGRPIEALRDAIRDIGMLQASVDGLVKDRELADAPPAYRPVRALQPDDRVAPHEVASRRSSAFLGGLILGTILGVGLTFAWITGAIAADKPDDKYKIRDRYGRVQGTLTPDPNVDGRLKVRDQYGRVQGTIDSDGKARDRNSRPVPLTDLIKPDSKK